MPKLILWVWKTTLCYYITKTRLNSEFLCFSRIIKKESSQIRALLFLRNSLQIVINRKGSHQLFTLVRTKFL
jgi:hypothetical protein